MPEAESATEPCELCGGRGWIVRADGRAGTAEPCPCRKRGEAGRLLEAAGIPTRYRGCKLSNFDTSHHEPRRRDQLLRARKVSEQYIEGFLGSDGRFREFGLIYIGRPGVGKTHLAVAVLTELVQRYLLRGLFTDFTSLVHQIQATFDAGSAESKHDVLDPVMQAELLVLDELGAQKPSPWVSEILYLIINTRYGRRLPTIFTTNYRLDTEPSEAASLDRSSSSPGLTPEALSSRIHAGLVSRLCEMAQPVVIDAEDFRREAKMHSQRV